MTIIAWISQKGGVGKTTTCLQVAALLAHEFGKQVLIIDLDSNACASLLLDVTVDRGESLRLLFQGERELAESVRKTVVPGLYLVPGSPDLRQIELETPARERQQGANGRLSEWILAEELEGLASSFDYVFIDCPGGHAYMQHSALLACDWVIVPTTIAGFDLAGANYTLALIDVAREARADGSPDLLGLVPIKVSSKGINEITRRLLDTVSDRWLSPIRDTTSVDKDSLRDALAEQKQAATTQDDIQVEGVARTLSEVDIRRRITVLTRPNSPVSKSYRALALEVMEKASRKCVDQPVPVMEGAHVG